MLTYLKRHQHHRPPPRHKPLNRLRLGILQRPPKNQARIRGEQLLEVFPFSAGTEQECSRCEEGEGRWVGDWCYVKGLEEGFVEGVENGVLGVDGYGSVWVRI